jgi:uncharacterized membrane protein YphA (DoxX/SURF4 family)
MGNGFQFDSSDSTQFKENPMKLAATMKVVATIARLLLGAVFVVYGMNLYLHFLPMQMPTGVALEFLGALASTHYLYVIAVFEVIPGLFLLFNRYVPLALALLAPVIFNILVFHTLMDPSGLLLAVLVALLWVLVYHRHRSAFLGLFQKRAED